MSFSIPEENLEEFKASAMILTVETAKEEGSVNFFFSKVGEEKDNTFTLYEEWANDEALNAHKEMPHFINEFSEKIAKYWIFKSGTFVKGTPL